MTQAKQQFMDSVSAWYDTAVKAGRHYDIEGIVPSRHEDKPSGEILLVLQTTLQPADGTPEHTAELVDVDEDEDA